MDAATLCGPLDSRPAILHRGVPMPLIGLVFALSPALVTLVTEAEQVERVYRVGFVPLRVVAMGAARKNGIRA